jgi:hypothetical protein
VYPLPGNLQSLRSHNFFTKPFTSVITICFQNTDLQALFALHSIVFSLAGINYLLWIHQVSEILTLTKVFFYSPTDAQVNCLKNNFKIYIKIDFKIPLTCFGAIAISGSALFKLAKVTVVK